MTLDHDLGDQPIEHDPTGMRALLRALPDPGAMPIDLVARIQASLAAEAARTAGTHAAAATPASAAAIASAPRGEALAASSSPVLSPTRTSPRNRTPRIASPGRWLAAAAAAGVVAVGGSALVQSGLLGFDASDTASSQSLNGASIAAGAAEDDGVRLGQDETRSASSATSGRDGNQSLPGDSAKRTVTVTMSNTAFTTADAAEQIRTYLQTSWQPISANAPESPGNGPIATPLGARSCAETLGLPLTSSLTIDLATLDGSPAALIVAADEGGARTAYLVGRACTTGAPKILAGPFPLG